MKRVTISVSEQAADRLLELAGSQRKQGEFVERTIDALYENKETGGVNLATSELNLKVRGLMSELAEMRSRVELLEHSKLHQTT